MTKKEADEEAAKIIRERNTEAQNIIEKAMEDGTWKPGLDTNRELFDELDQRTKKRLRELAEKID